MRNARNHSENWRMGQHSVLDVTVAPSIESKGCAAFFESALADVPCIEIRLHCLQADKGTPEVLSGKYHACILSGERD